jgi:hypothetical protein
MSRATFAVTAVLFFAGCASETKRYSPLALNYHVFYYDRNHDGVVDYFLVTDHNSQADPDWALVDTKFRGRYDLLIHFGHVIKKERVDIPVDKDVKITPGKPPKRYMP